MLTENQKPAVEWIAKNVLEGREQFMTLVGQGGSGKTFCIMDLVAQLQQAGLKTIFSAPTNKAVKQLEKAARKYGLSGDNVAFMTTHAALGLAILPNEDQKFTTKAGKGFIEFFDVIVVDECSMLSKIALFKYLVPECQAFNTMLIGMGDDFQLPPVRESVSAIFTEFPSWRLAGNERQNEGPLLALNTALRQAMLDDRPFSPPVPDGEQVIEVPDAKFLKTIVDDFEVDTDLDTQRVIAWSNTRVAQVNNAIRKKLFGADADRFVKGERVVTGGPVKDSENQVILGTDEECIVHHVDMNSSLYDENSGTEYRTIQLVLEPLYLPGQVIVEVLHSDEVARFEEQVAAMAKDARESKQFSRQLWAKFWGFKELFADVRHCYCITVHRSQGSTFDKLYFDLKDALRNRNRIERRRLVYVGYSRPRHQLIINKRKYVV